jgi:release factor glutamine methyltransferase
VSESLTIDDAIREAAAYLSRHGITSARLDAEVLLAFALSRDRSRLYLEKNKPPTEQEKSNYRELLRRRAQHEPVAYITGKKEFWSMEFTVNRSVMIPRPETEILVERAVEKALLLAQSSEELTLFDIGTGSGAVVISLAVELNRRLEPQTALRRNIIASDTSEQALEVARSNASRLAPNLPIEFLHGSFFAGNDDVLDLVVTNPPYVALSEKDSLMPEVSLWEPPEAIFAGEDALACIKRIIAESPEHLRSGGFLLMEFGLGQRQKIEQILLSSGSFCHIEFFRDYSGTERVVSAERA